MQTDRNGIFEELYRRALMFAEEKHRGQTDRAGVPYIEHPKKVASFCTTPTAKICALLHDTLEDTDAQEAEIRDLFGDEVADTVVLLTRRNGDDVESYMEYVRRLGDSPTAREVKLADLKHNMDLTRTWPIGESDVQRVVKKYVPAFNYLMGLERGVRENFQEIKEKTS